MLALRLGGRLPRPSPWYTVLALVLCALFVRLGLWQWHKGVAREEAWTRFARGADQLLALGTRPADAPPLYQRVSVEGGLDGAHQFLLDNRSSRGRAGYEVLTPLRRAGEKTLLVDRGWVAFTGSRAELPAVSLDVPAPVRLSGRLAELPSPGLALGRAAPQALAPWPKVTSFPSTDELARALGEPIASRILLLDPEAPYGYARDWQPPGMTPLRHFAYAIQWWCFAGLALALWLLMSLRPRAGALPR